ncbi:MAG: phosphatidylserine decarboxylase [Campylobacterales bacterium]|nr:phosphatidylserine decarboxylase [Campylobacterales bacterium]
MSHFTNIVSRGFGHIANYEFPSTVQGAINSLYVNILGLDMSEFDKPYKYPTLNKLFTRALNRPREFDKDEKVLISPCDSMITECSQGKNTQFFQIKGVEYQIDSLLTDIDKEAVEKIYNGQYTNFYLSPKDYHRYHAPCDLKIEKLVYVPAKLYPVNTPALKYIKNLFIENERVILQCKTNTGKTMILVYVGALNVGEMVFNFEERVETNKDLEKMIFDYEDLKVTKGDDMGHFKMGSTVLMFTEPDTVNFSVMSGEDVSYSQSIGTFTD